MHEFEVHNDREQKPFSMILTVLLDALAIYKSVHVLALSTGIIDYDLSNILNEKHKPQWRVPSKHDLVHLHTRLP